MSDSDDYDSEADEDYVPNGKCDDFCNHKI